jgi:protein SCO1/2
MGLVLVINTAVNVIEEMPMSRIILRRYFVPVAAALCCGLAACEPSGGVTSGSNTVVAGKAAIGGSFSLIDHTGKDVTEADFLGKPQLIYFGFGYCPDVCPTALQKIGAAQDLVDKEGDVFQPMFFTVDPERDTPEQLALYISAKGFPKGLVGLTGSIEQVEAAKKTFAIYGAKVEDESSVGGVTFDHSNVIYLMDAQGEFVDVFSGNDSPEKIAKRLKTYIKNGV